MNYIITGLISSGKSTFLNIASKRGFNIIRSDDLVSNYYKDKVVLENLKRKLDIEEFRDSPKVEIKELFLKSRKYKELIESVIHPIVHDEIKRELEHNNNLMVELPPISNNINLVKDNPSIFIECSSENRLLRFEKSMNIDREYFERMNEYQNDYSLIKSSCDIIFNNDQNLEVLEDNFNKYINKS